MERSDDHAVADAVKEQEAAPRVIGIGPAAGALRTIMASLASSQTDVLLLGEPGAGKGHFADALHHLTFPQGGGGVVEVTPATGEEELRTVLFDEERKKQEGILGRPVPRLDGQSTLFVRSLQEFSFLGQSRIARFLIQNEAVRNQGHPGVRVVLALPDRPEEPAGGRMLSESLAAYLQKFERVRIPPLRERLEDIPVLVDHFLRLHPPPHPPAAEPALLEHLSGLPYPDNIRELRYLVHEMVQNSRGGELVLPGLVLDEVGLVRGLLSGVVQGRRTMLEDSLAGLEKALVRRALIRTNGDRTRAAALLGLSEINLRYRVKKFGLG